MRDVVVASTVLVIVTMLLNALTLFLCRDRSALYNNQTRLLHKEDSKYESSSPCYPPNAFESLVKILSLSFRPTLQLRISPVITFRIRLAHEKRTRICLVHTMTILTQLAASKSFPF